MSESVTEATANSVGYTPTKGTAVLVIALIFLIVAVIVIIFFIRRGSPNTGDVCRDSGECASDEMCDVSSGMGICRKKAGEECTPDSCQSGQSCVAGRCQTVSSAALNEQCIDNTTNACQNGLICESDICKADIKSTCKVLSDCISGATGCVSSKCVVQETGELTGPCAKTGSQCKFGLQCSPATNKCLSIAGARCTNGDECLSGVCASGACTDSGNNNTPGMNSFTNQTIISPVSPIAGDRISLYVAPDTKNPCTNYQITTPLTGQSLWGFVIDRRLVQGFSYDGTTGLLTVRGFEITGEAYQNYVTLDKSCGCRLVRVPITDDANPVTWRLSRPSPLAGVGTKFPATYFQLAAIVDGQAFPLGSSSASNKLLKSGVSATVRRNQCLNNVVSFFEFPLTTQPSPLAF